MSNKEEKLSLMTNKEITLLGDLEVLLLLQLEKNLSYPDFISLLSRTFGQQKDSVLALLDPEYLRALKKNTLNSTVCP